MKGFTFVGVPIDSVGRAGGTEHAPGALRELGLPGALGADDAGDLAVRVRGDERDPGTGILASPDVLSVTGTIRDTVAASIRRGDRPFLAGGCCAELPGALGGARDALGRVGLVYLDGHLDLYDGTTSPTGEAADMPVATALGFGPPAWVEAAGGPSAAGADVALLGFRDPDELPTLARVLASGDLEGVALHPVDVIRGGASVTASMEAGPERFWLHLDVDVLDEAVFPATDYLMPGGLDWEELAVLMRPLVASPALIGASLGCYNPEKDPDRRYGRELVAVWSDLVSA